MGTVIVTNLPPVPKVAMFPNGTMGPMNTEWFKWFQALWGRVGGPSGDIIYNIYNSELPSQSSTPSDATIFGVGQEVEYGALAYNAPIPHPPVESEPVDDGAFQFAIGTARDTFSATFTAGTGLSGGGTLTNGATISYANAGVLSIIAGTDITVSGATGNVTVNAVQQAPNYEQFVAGAGQTVFNTTINTTAKAGTKAYLQVFKNGVFQQEGGAFAYTVTGANQITFNAGLVALDNVVVYGWS